ncbi:hypothetical protein [Bradyrhizobium pachyrhizi]|uniref:hypothetical protein n=1 Tax=Bradyrhizobium pachyrhizi TaxID=280333 RepID=UPI003D35DF57
MERRGKGDDIKSYVLSRPYDKVCSRLDLARTRQTALGSRRSNFEPTERSVTLRGSLRREDRDARQDAILEATPSFGAGLETSS